MPRIFQGKAFLKFLSNEVDEKEVSIHSWNPRARELVTPVKGVGHENSGAMQICKSHVITARLQRFRAQ